MSNHRLRKELPEENKVLSEEVAEKQLTKSKRAWRTLRAVGRFLLESLKFVARIFKGIEPQ